MIVTLAAQPGMLDPSFEADGIVFPEVGDSTTFCSAIVIDQQERSIVGGTIGNGDHTDFIVLRFLNDGTPDPSWGDEGTVLTDLAGEDDALHALAVQPDGKILALGGARVNTNYRIAMVRYHEDGTLDPTFDGDGKVLITGARGTDIALQPDGKIVIAGSPGADILIRLNPDGSLDGSFGTNGIAAFQWSTTNPFQENHVAIQSTGRILLSGGANYSIYWNIEVLALTPNGATDVTFGINGRANLSQGGGSYFRMREILVQPDDRILVAGDRETYQQTDFAIARFLPDGDPDESFDGDGLVYTDFSPFQFDDDEVRSMFLQPDGRIVASGVTNTSDFLERIAIARYETNGALDLTFGVDGKVVTGLVDTRQCDAIGSALQLDGKILICGKYQASGLPYSTHMVVLRYLTDLNVEVPEDPNDNRGVDPPFPNPTTGSLSFRSAQAPLTKAMVQVTNALGQVVLSGALDENSSLDVAQLATGTYAVRIFTIPNAVGYIGRFLKL